MYTLLQIGGFCRTLIRSVFQFAELGCTVTHLALAWVAKCATTSTVILGASKPEQVVDNLKAIDIIPKLSPGVLEKIEQILQNKPEQAVSTRTVKFRLDLTIYCSPHSEGPRSMTLHEH